MYNMPTSASRIGQLQDSKYTVADILSSMANGEPVTPTSTWAPAFTCGSVATVTTPTLTPTTIANLEQTFIDLQTVPVSASQHVQSGFVPPVIEPVSSSTYDKYEDSLVDSDDSDWMPQAKRSRRSNGNSLDYSALARKYPSKRRRDLKGEKVPPEEEERRRVRRERNKMAAAKCRQRRVEVTNVLITETEDLEEQKSSLEHEIQTLQQQKEQLEFLLQAHRPTCKHNKESTIQQNRKPIIVKAEPSSSSCQARKQKPRPNTLPIKTETKMDEVTGVPITTPSAGILTFGFDQMVDGSTGLTPITGPSCASQVQRSSSESSPDALASPKLISL